MSPPLSRLVVASALLVGCGHDWDPFDPRGDNAGSGASGGATASAGGAGGQGGGTGATGASSTGGAGANGGDGGGAPAGCNKMTILADDFEDGDLDWRWETSDNTASSSEAGGTLSISLPGAPVEDSYALVRSVRMHDLTDSQVSVRVLGADLSGDSEGAWFSVDYVPETWLEFLLLDGQLVADVSLGGEFTTLASVPFDPRQHAVWRMREQAGTVFFETSADGDVFDALASIPASETFPLDLLTTEVGAWKDAGVPEDRLVVFDDFNGGTSVGAFCPIGDLQDDFDDDFPARIWSRGDDDGGTLLEETGGQVVVTLASDPEDGYGYYWTATSFDVTGGGAVSVEVVAIPDQSTSAETWLSIHDLTGDNSIEALLAYGTLICRRWEYADYMPPFAEVPFDGDVHRFWRLRESGGEVVCETSPDAQSWDALGQTPAFFPLEAVDASFGSGTWEPQPAPGSAAFDDFNAAP